MINLVQNEVMKLLAKKRLWVITAIVAVLVSLFTYAQIKQIETIRERLGTTDWRATLQQQIIDTQNRLTSSRISEEWKAQLEIRLAQQQYYLDENINPSEPGAPTFVREFSDNAIDLFIPLLVIVVASDLVSSERSQGSIKLLLTRPIKRWKILMSKYITLLLSVSVIVAIVGFLSYVISGLVFGYSGWTAPILYGFDASTGQLDVSHVQLIHQWEYVLMSFGLVWFVAVVVGTLSFMLSVLVRSTAAGMGIVLASLIAGAILREVVSSWEAAKYLFMVNLDLTDYLQGSAPPIEGMTLSQSSTILLAWWFVALLVSFTVFTKQDIY